MRILEPTGLPMGDTVAMPYADYRILAGAIERAQRAAVLVGDLAASVALETAVSALDAAFVQCLFCASPIEPGADRCAFHVDEAERSSTELEREDRATIEREAGVPL